jgi:hypothetical protein
VNAFKRNESIPEGASVTVHWRWVNRKTKVPIDITGYSARMQLRSSHTAADPVTTLSTDNGRIVLGGEDGTIDLDFDLVTHPVPAGRYVFDLLMIPSSGPRRRLVEGIITISPAVTRDE